MYLVFTYYGGNYAILSRHYKSGGHFWHYVSNVGNGWNVCRWFSNKRPKRSGQLVSTVPKVGRSLYFYFTFNICKTFFSYLPKIISSSKPSSIFIVWPVDLLILQCHQLFVCLKNCHLYLLLKKEMAYSDNDKKAELTYLHM